MKADSAGEGDPEASSLAGSVCSLLSHLSIYPGLAQCKNPLPAIMV